MTIHWWNTAKAVDQLADEGVSESEAVYYAMFGSSLYSLAIYYAVWVGGYREWLLIYEFGVMILIGIVGVNECFKANGGSQGSNFLGRLALLSVPLGIKLTLAGAALGQLAYYGFPYVVTQESYRDPEHVYRLFCFGFATAFLAAFYWRMTKHLSRLANKLRLNQTEINRVSIN